MLLPRRRGAVRGDGATDYRTRQWPAALAASVLRDRQDMGANLGYNRDLSGDDGVRWSLRRWDETTITTVNGVEP